MAQVCMGCGAPATCSAHIIAQSRVKNLGMTELCWAEENYFPACYVCNSRIENPKGDGWFCSSMRGRRIDPIKKSRSDYDKTIKIKQYIECRLDNKTNCLTTVSKDNVAVKDVAPRRPIDECEYRWLTPNEYEALQTVPKDYTASVSDNQRRRMLGNGWTVDVIAFIFSFIK